jgi:hypothetical protein
LPAIPDVEPAVVQPFLPVMLPFLQAVLSIESQGETHYCATVTNTLAFPASLIQFGPEAFEYEQWLPLIVGKLVIKRDGKYTDTIHRTALGGQSPIAGLLGEKRSFWHIVLRYLD